MSTTFVSLPNLSAEVVAESAVVGSLSVLVGGVLQRDLQAEVVARSVVGSDAATAGDNPTEGVGGASGSGVAFLHPLTALGGAGDYAFTPLPPGLEPGGDGVLHPGMETLAGSFMHPVTATGDGDAPVVPGYAFAAGEMAALISQATGLTGTIGRAAGAMRPLIALGSEGPHAETPLPPGLEPGALPPTFTLTFDGETTDPIPVDATPEEVQAALEALDNIDPGDVIVTGEPGGPFTITFDDSLGDVPELTGELSPGASGTVTIVTVTEGETGVTDEVQTVTLENVLPFIPGEAGSFMHPLVSLGFDPGPPEIVEDPEDPEAAPITIREEVMQMVLFIPDEATANVNVVVAAAESVTMSDTATFLFVADQDALETVTVTAALTPEVEVTVAVAETIQVLFAGERTDAYVTWVLNRETNASSHYDGWAFNGLIQWQGHMLGTSESGLYELTGDTDDGDLIVASVLLPVTDYGQSFKMQIDEVMLGVESQGEIHVKAHTDDGKQRTYRARPTHDLRTRRVQMGKALFSRYWQVEITNPDGEDFALDTAELIPNASKRRV